MDISNQDFAPRLPRPAMSGQTPQHPTLAQALAQSLLMPSTIQGTSPATPAEPKTSPTKSTLAMQATYSRAYPRTKAHVRICNLSSLLCSDSQQCTSFPRQLCRPRRARPIPPDPAPDRRHTRQPPHAFAAPLTGHRRSTAPPAGGCGSGSSHLAPVGYCERPLPGDPLRVLCRNNGSMHYTCPARKDDL
jgi:hypothetical protein